MSGWEIVAVVVYLMLTGYLGFLGWRGTRSASDYMLAGRKAHPLVMALSYGATFISTSAIVGFGGVAAMFGMSLLWLVFLNIFVGIFIAFVVLGGRIRRIGHALDAHTFPELLGRRYQSRWLQVLVGLVIFIFMPVYTAAVLIGGAEFICQHFDWPYYAAVLVFAVLTAAYVIAGGLKGVMYTDALQAVIMIVAMGILLIWTYNTLNGVTGAHEGLSAMNDQVPAGHRAMGMEGWTKYPAFGWGEKKADLWWLVFSTITLGVGIGVLAQPQLAVRFMTVRSQRELNRGVMLGGLFILMLPGVAYTVGALSNLYFYKHEVVRGELVSEGPSDLVTKVARYEADKTAPVWLLHIDTTRTGSADTHVIADWIEKDGTRRPLAEVTRLEGNRVEVRPKTCSFFRAVVDTQKADASGQPVYMLNSDSIIPIFINSSTQRWFGVLFLVTLLAAGMSTLSGQLHAMGTSLGHDVCAQFSAGRTGTIALTRAGIIVGLVLAVAISLYARGGYIIARSTAIFFGLCTSAFLPALVGGLFTRRATKAGAVASMIVGAIVTALWLTFVKDTEARALGICHAITGKASLLLDKPNWPSVDPVVIALPLSAITMIIVSLLTRRPDEQHLERVFSKQNA